MNYKKGLVALAITGALATPMVASAAAKFVTYGGQNPTSITGQTGPQTGATNVSGSISATVGIDAFAIYNDDVTIDQIRKGEAVDFDADAPYAVSSHLTNGSFTGSARTDVSLGYAADVEIPNEATLTFKFHDGSGFDANGNANVLPEGGFAPADITNVRLVAQVQVPGNSLVVANDFVEVGKVIDYTTVNGVVTEFVIQVDTNVDRLDGNYFHSRYAGTVTPGLPTVVPVNSPTGLLKADPLPSNIQLFLASSAENANNGSGAYNPVTVQLAATAAKGDEAHLALQEARNTSGQVIGALSNGADSHVLTVTDGFELTVVDQATTTIEVETDRTTFADCETWDETVTTTGPDAFQDYVCASSGDRLISRAKLKFDSTADVGLDVRNTNTMEFSLSRVDKESVDGVDNVTFGAATTTFSSTTQAFSGSGTLLSIGLMDATNANLEADLDIEADGVTPLFPNAQNAADWVLSNVVIKAGGSLTNDVTVPVVYGETTTVVGGTTYNRDDAQSVKEDGVTHVWGIDGALFKTPYLYSLPNANGWGSVVKVTNEFTEHAGIEADIIIAPSGEGSYNLNGENPPLTDKGMTFVGVKLPKMVPAQGQYTFNGTDLIKAINTKYGANTVDESKNWHIEATFLVNAPQNYVHAAAQNKSPDGRADSPVLYKTNNGNDGRQWQ
jgi:hypothetical protein